jgi:hypothetical protein
MALTIAVSVASNLTLKGLVGLVGRFASRLMLFLGMKARSAVSGINMSGAWNLKQKEITAWITEYKTRIVSWNDSRTAVSGINMLKEITARITTIFNESTTFRNQTMRVLFIIYTALQVSAYMQAIFRCYLTILQWSSY